MLVLSVVWLALVVADLTGHSSKLTQTFGVVIWVIFIAEFLLRLILAPRRLSFLARNWLTIIALVVPAFRILAAFRAFRVLRALRGVSIVRIVGTANRGMNALRRSMRRRGVGYVVLLTIGVTLLGAAGMLRFETASAASPGFSNFGDALWWTAMIMTTMGTDFWPHTVEGRTLCFLLALYGFGVFGYITASFASFFVGQDARSPKADIAGSKDIDALRREIALLRTALRASTSAG
jgi:voltage-gated potassium channel